MAYNTIANFIASDCNFVPLPRSWYELEVDTINYKTFRFAKRTDHTGILFKLDMDELYKHQELAPDS